MGAHVVYIGGGGLFHMGLYNSIGHFEVIWGGKYALWTPQIK